MTKDTVNSKGTAPSTTLHSVGANRFFTIFTAAGLKLFRINKNNSFGMNKNDCCEIAINGALLLKIL